MPIRPPARSLLYLVLGFFALAAIAPHAVAESRNIGHRGYEIAAPENTLVGIQLAFDTGAEGVEIDLNRTIDGNIVVIHDGTVDRTTNGTGAVGSLTVAQLKLLDAGSWFAPEFAGEQIPTLEEALALIKGQGVAVLDFKGFGWDGGARAPVATAISTTGIAASDVFVRSETYPHIVDLLTHVPGTRIIYVVWEPDNLSDALLMDMVDFGVAALAFHHGIDSADVSWVHSYGMEVYEGNVDNLTGWTKMIGLGVEWVDTRFVAELEEQLEGLPVDCADGIDNDGDGFTDFPADPGCASAGDSSERNSAVACDDGIDNDGDLLPDFANDPHCVSPIDANEAGPSPVPGLSPWAIAVLVSLLSGTAMRSVRARASPRDPITGDQ